MQCLGRKLMTKFILLAAITLFSTGFVLGQNSGYLGKTMILKSDLTNLFPRSGVGFNAEVEFAVSRKFSIFAYYDNDKFKSQKSNLVISYGYNYPWFDGKVSANSVGLGIRIFNESAIPAPKGSFYYLSCGGGIADYSSTHYKYFDNLSGSDNFDVQDFTLKNIKYGQIEIGYGLQTILKDIIVAEFSFGYNVVIPFIDDEYSEYTKDLHFGSNLLNVAYILDRVFDEGSSGAADFLGGHGLNLNVKIGVLLF